MIKPVNHMASRTSKSNATSAQGDVAGHITMALRLIQDRAENSEKYHDLVQTLNNIETRTLISGITAAITTIDPGSLKEVPLLLESIKTLPDLQSQLLAKAKTVPVDSMKRCSLLFIYRVLPGPRFHGYRCIGTSL